MRLLFLFLLLVNGAFAGLLYWGPAPDRQQLADLPTKVATIEMINEIAPVSEVHSGPVSALPGISQCYTLGPFKDQSGMLVIMDALRGRVADAIQRSKQESRHHRYWVYIPAQKNRQEAIAMSRRLARNKVKDYYIVRGGDRNNSISLGHFKEKVHADRRIKSLKQLGFDVQIEPIYRQYELYWLDYTVPAGSHIEEGFWSALLPDGVSRLKRDCR